MEVTTRLARLKKEGEKKGDRKISRARRELELSLPLARMGQTKTKGNLMAPVATGWATTTWRRRLAR